MCLRTLLCCIRRFTNALLLRSEFPAFSTLFLAPPATSTPYMPVQHALSVMWGYTYFVTLACVVWGFTNFIMRSVAG